MKPNIWHSVLFLIPFHLAMSTEPIAKSTVISSRKRGTGRNIGIMKVASSQDEILLPFAKEQCFALEFN